MYSSCLKKKSYAQTQDSKTPKRPQGFSNSALSSNDPMLLGNATEVKNKLVAKAGPSSPHSLFNAFFHSGEGDLEGW